VDTTPLWLWASTVGVVLALLAFDFVMATRFPHRVGLVEAALVSVGYVGIALLFGLVLWLFADPKTGTEYLTGWLVEKSLSVDNLFVFVIILSRFAVPQEYQQKVLLFGIAAALVLRAVLIAMGAAAIKLFASTFLVFGLLLIFTAVQLVRHRNEDPDPEDNPVFRYARRILPTADPQGGRLFARADGRIAVTPLFLVFVSIGSTDLLFALDSIPAVFGVTHDPFVVFSANAFALLGLRALYFLIQGLLERLIYLSLGLAAILAFIGVKLILEFVHVEIASGAPTIPIPVSLAFILGVLAATSVASVIVSRRRPQRRAHPGAVRLSGRRRTSESQ
jgi:tellurite resistance protein TerC